MWWWEDEREVEGEVVRDERDSERIADLGPAKRERHRQLPQRNTPASKEHRYNAPS